jgi:hypothetical protein
MESMLNDIVAMGIEEGHVPFQMTEKVMVQALRKGKACNGMVCKDKSFNANACKGKASYDNASRDYASIGNHMLG